MTIKAQLRMLLLITGIILAVMFGIVFQSSRVGEYYQARGVKLAEIIKDVFDFNVAAGDYTLNHSERALDQMELRINSLAKPLATITFARADRQAVVVDMKKELERARIIFQKLRKSHRSYKTTYGAVISEEIDEFGHQEIQDLASSLSISAMTLVTSAQYLMKASVEKQLIEIKFYDRLLMACMAISFTLLFCTLLLFSRRFITSVESLKNGAARISGGDFATKVEITGNDELTDLSSSINEMSQKLQVSYEELEDEIEERKRTEESLLESEQQIRDLNVQLEQKIINLNETNNKLQEANKEMESFTYSVSHDLRAPLRHLTGFVELLVRRDISGLDEKSRHYLKVIADAASKMGCLIDDLLSFSRMGRGEMMNNSIDLKQLTREVIDEISRDIPQGRTVQWRIGDLPVITGDHAMLRLVLINLITNAVKYSNNVDSPLIEVDKLRSDNSCHALFVRDNGVGFDMKYVDKLFGLFQRLHSSEEYEGTGVGLANVRRIISRHGGRTWAEGELNKGATFYFTLPDVKENSI